jgi:hypothetical protein
MSRSTTWARSSRTTSSWAPFSTSSASAILALAIVVSFRGKSFVQKQPSPRATMAAPYPPGPLPYTTPGGTIRRRDAIALRPCDSGGNCGDAARPRRLSMRHLPDGLGRLGHRPRPPGSDHDRPYRADSARAGEIGSENRTGNLQLAHGRCNGMRAQFPDRRPAWFARELVRTQRPTIGTRIAAENSKDGRA